MDSPLLLKMYKDDIQKRHGGRWFHTVTSFAFAKFDTNPIHGCIGFVLAERDSSGILFIAAVLQKQPSTGGEALRDVIKRNKKIQADSPVFVLAQRQAQKSAHKNKNKKMQERRCTCLVFTDISRQQLFKLI